MIDVVIPVYRGLAATRRCIESVRRARGDEPCEIVVIDDCSPEPEITAWLREIAAAAEITLLSHEENRGFVASVNEGMALHPERDVVLLNSDTEVPANWLERLAACARREPQVATVTPFSNNATICSYPGFATSNPLPAGTDLATLDRHFQAQNAGQCIDLPTAVGFCMFISRVALDAVGRFDEAAFGRGYGEEVDFCMRAARAGFRHVLCTDLFVYHEGEVSFGAGAQEIRNRAQAIVDERYPEFQPLVRQFIDREPTRPFRRRVDMARIAASARPRLLLVSHTWGGGVERHMRDVARLLENDREVMLLHPADEDTVRITWLRQGEEFAAWLDHRKEWDEVIALLKALGVGRVHFHHVHGLPQKIVDLAGALNVPYDVTLHDFHPICPQYHMAPEGSRSCETMSQPCHRCLDSRPAQWPVTLEQWRNIFHVFLRNAARVIVPSADAGNRIRRYFPDVPTLEWSHPEPAPAAPALFKVALLGGQSSIKGARVLEACVQDAAARSLPLHFHVIGHVDRPMPLWPEAPLTVGGSYPELRLQEVIAIERPDAFLFLSQVPETYSYTLSAAMQSCLPILATRLGAFPERLQGYRRHALVAVDDSAAAINDALLELLRAGTSAAYPPAAAD